MKYGSVRKLTRVAILSFLMLATTSGLAGLEVMAASSAMAAPSDQGDSPNPNPGSQDKPKDPISSLVSGLTNSISAPVH